MTLENLNIGFAVTGSFCTIAEAMPQLEALVSLGAEVTPIVSEIVYSTDTRFGKAAALILRIEAITGKKIINSISGAEPIGPKKLLDALVIAPCTGNTLSKLANGINDTTVTMAAKAHLRNKRPLVIAVSTNDGLGFNAKNLGLLMNSKNIYFVPFRQDDALNKSNSVIAEMTLILPALSAALNGEQLQPVLL
ncbi:MAG: dipicolinate synthase subunit B [Clostridiales bacterium]|nr:dipicolinate synthase subunit B [Clostridiales bacterium]